MEKVRRCSCSPHHTRLSLWPEGDSRGVWRREDSKYVCIPPTFDVFAHPVFFSAQPPRVTIITTLSHLLTAIPTTLPLLAMSTKALARNARPQLSLTRTPVTPTSQRLNLPHPPQTTQIL